MKEQPPAQFAWLNIGSQGRKEQLLLTDQDNALVLKMYPQKDTMRLKILYRISRKCDECIK
jgi:CBS domain-containing protein